MPMASWSSMFERPSASARSVSSLLCLVVFRVLRRFGHRVQGEFRSRGDSENGQDFAQRRQTVRFGAEIALRRTLPSTPTKCHIPTEFASCDNNTSESRIHRQHSDARRWSGAVVSTSHIERLAAAVALVSV